MTEFEKIYQMYFKDVFLFVKGLSQNDSIAEDITSETFFKAMNALDSFNRTCDVRVWLCQIAKNSYYSYLRKHGKMADLNKFDIHDDSISLEENLADKETASKIHIILHKLPEPYKEVFTLRVFGELSFLQIGKIFGRSENWSCVTYHRARKKIQNQLEGFMNEKNKL